MSLFDALDWESDETRAARAADRHRKAEGLRVLRDYVPEAFEIIEHFEAARGQGSSWGIGGTSGDEFRCAYRWTDRGFEWTSSVSRGGDGQRITWAELRELVEDDALRHRAIEWSRSLTEVDAWRDRYRPFGLWPHPEMWHPSYFERDRARAGFAERMKAWRQIRGALSTAIAALEVDAEEDAA